MEVAIPLLALGGIYVVSNQKKKDNNNNIKEDKLKQKLHQENFTNMGKDPNYLPNLDIPPQNFPVTNTNQLIDSTLYKYPNPNVATDKYFDQNLYENNVRKGISVGRNPQLGPRGGQREAVRHRFARLQGLISPGRAGTCRSRCPRRCRATRPPRPCRQ